MYPRFDFRNYFVDAYAYRKLKVRYLSMVLFFVIWLLVHMGIATVTQNSKFLKINDLYIIRCGIKG